MSSKNTRKILNIVVMIPVALIVIAACSLAALAMQENIRFIQSTNQIFALVDSVRTAAAQQMTFAQNAGEDLWVSLVRMGREKTDGTRTNQWGGQIRMMTVSTQAGPVAMRLESDVPTRDCRRIALSFIARQPENLNILTVEAQGAESDKWILIYPLSTPVYDRAAMFACGHGDSAKLAVSFKIR